MIPLVKGIQRPTLQDECRHTQLVTELVLEKTAFHYCPILNTFEKKIQGLQQGIASWRMVRKRVANLILG